jgi:hypothetical protein
MNSKSYITNASISRWMNLFGFTEERARKEMESHLENLSRKELFRSQWAQLIREAEEEKGNHDIQSYTYLLYRLSEKKKAPAAKKDPAAGTETKLACGTISSVEEYLASMPAIPPAPTLSINTTSREIQDIYFYGTLANKESFVWILEALFLETYVEDGNPILDGAVLRGGKLQTLGRQYTPLLDAKERNAEEAWAYVIKSDSYEDAQRIIEKGYFKMARCDFEVGTPGRLGGMETEMVHGWTFQFSRTRKEFFTSYFFPER